LVAAHLGAVFLTQEGVETMPFVPDRWCPVSPKGGPRPEHHRVQRRWFLGDGPKEDRFPYPDRGRNFIKTLFKVKRA